MTETTAAIPGTPGDIYPDSVGFGFAELIVLLNLQRGPAATASAHALRLQHELEDPQLLSAGASSLVARGAATVEPGGELSVAGPVAAVTRALTSATRRMQLTLLTADSGDSVLSVESEKYRILLQPRAYLSWFAMAQKPDVSAAEANFYIVRKHLGENPAGGAMIRRLEDAGGRQLLIKRSGDTWAVGYSESSAVAAPIDEVSGLSDADVLDRIRAIRQD